MNETPAAINWALAGEALAAVSGLFPTKAIAPEEGDKAEGIAEEIGKAAEKFCQFGAFEAFKLQPKANFEEVYAKLQPLTAEEEAIATADLASPDLIQAWREAVNRARAYLREQWPVIIRQSPTGPEWMEPSRTDSGRASALLMVLEDPRTLLDEMNRGAMTPSMVDAVSACRPELFPYMRQAVSVALDEAKEKKRRCPSAHESQLRLLFGLAPVGLVTFGAGNAQKATKASEFSIDFEGLRTKNQTVR